MTRDKDQPAKDLPKPKRRKIDLSPLSQENHSPLPPSSHPSLPSSLPSSPTRLLNPQSSLALPCSLQDITEVSNQRIESSSPKGESLENVPPELLNNLKWSHNSCHFDTFVECIYFALVQIESDHLHGPYDLEIKSRTSPNEFIIDFLKFRHRAHERERDVRTKQNFRNTFSDHFGDGSSGGNNMSTLNWWLETLTNDHHSFVGLKYTIKFSCENSHHFQTEEYQRMIVLRGNDLRTSLLMAQDEISRTRVRQCQCGAGALSNETIITNFLPIIIAEMSNLDFELEKEELIFFGKSLNIRAAARFLRSSAHFICYLRRGEMAWEYDGLKGVSLASKWNSSRFAGEPSLIFLS